MSEDILERVARVIDEITGLSGGAWPTVSDVAGSRDIARALADAGLVRDGQESIRLIQLENQMDFTIKNFDAALEVARRRQERIEKALVVLAEGDELDLGDGAAGARIIDSARAALTGESDPGKAVYRPGDVECDGGPFCSAKRHYGFCPKSDPGERIHEGTDPSHGGLTTHKGTRADCSYCDPGEVQ